MDAKKSSRKSKKQPRRRSPGAGNREPVIESSRTADDVRRAEELIEKHGWEHLRDKKK
ncbi:MAG TPA: hypothetical protein VNA69_23985 [Thermoanaerobaculia bacterium]|nr:hypothetical protein [Thermoanaerobaculia bacterium]